MEGLPAGSAEWQEVNAFFRATAPDAATVLAIQRVENPLLRAEYEARRAAMDARAAAGYGLRGANEARLFHGTSAAAADGIVQQGFNRSFGFAAGAHAFGRGTYFARSAAYSAQPRYSQPDAAGVQRVLVARVLVGDACVGTQQDLVPPRQRPCSAGPLDLCDSTVDREDSPNIYVTYRDNQQLPVHLILFRMLPA